MNISPRPLIVAALVFIVAAGSFGMAQDKKSSKKTSKEVTGAVIHTNYGDIEIEFYPKDAPKTVANWIGLAKKGYYDGVIFHRVIKGFMMQGGDPTGTGSGGESIYGRTFEDEIDPGSALYQTGYKRGVMAMANAGPNTNGSQFFIMHADYPLQPNYTIFAHVTKGMDVVDKICTAKTKPGDRPVEDIVMKSITLK